MRESEWLFPNRDGGYRAETHLDFAAFRIVTDELCLRSTSNRARYVARSKTWLALPRCAIS